MDRDHCHSKHRDCCRRTGSSSQVSGCTGPGAAVGRSNIGHSVTVPLEISITSGGVLPLRQSLQECKLSSAQRENETEMEVEVKVEVERPSNDQAA